MGDWIETEIQGAVEVITNAEEAFECFSGGGATHDGLGNEGGFFVFPFGWLGEPIWIVVENCSSVKGLDLVLDFEVFLDS